MYAVVLAGAAATAAGGGSVTEMCPRRFAHRAKAVTLVAKLAKDLSLDFVGQAALRDLEVRTVTTTVTRWRATYEVTTTRLPPFAPQQQVFIVACHV